MKFLALFILCVSASFIQLDFDIRRGDRLESSSPLNERRFVKRKDSLEVVLSNEQTFYTVNLLIGQEKQNVSVVIDTGSSDLWVVASSNPYCETTSRNESQSEKSPPLFTPHTYGTTLPTTSQPGSYSTPTSSVVPSLDCGTYGVYNYETSFKSNSTEFLIQYADLTFAHGQYGYDDVIIAGTTIRDLSFAVANVTNSSLGVLGIGPAGSQASYSGQLSMTNRYMYENLPMKMVAQRLIQKNAYSLYLSNSSDGSKGTLLFGAVDHEKYSGKLQTVKVVNRYKSFGYLNPISLDMTLSGVSFESLGSSEMLTNASFSAFFDSGTTSVYAPSDVIAKIASRVGGIYSESVRAYVVECSGFENQFLSFDFTGAIIKVPIQDLLVTLAPIDEYSGSCALGIFPGGGEHVILGSSFLKSVYSVFDLDKLEVSMAQSRTSESSNVEVISSSVPSAVRAPHYSATFVSSGDVSTTFESKGLKVTWSVLCALVCLLVMCV